MASKASATGIYWQGAATAAKGPDRGFSRQPRTAASYEAAAPAAAEAMDSEVATVAQYTAGKYRLLMDGLRDPGTQNIEPLRRDLLARELLTGAIKAAREANDPAKAAETERQEAALAKVEGQIRGRLHPSDFATYELLKDADAELFQLDDYARGISNVAPLSAADLDSILRTKLVYKARFHQLLQDSGLMRDNLGAGEREYAYTAAARALEDYQRSYLQEVRQFLADDEQYALLSNYENTEFKAERAKLEVVASTNR